MFKPDKVLSEKIDRWIEGQRDSFVRDLDKLVAVPSVSEQGDGRYPFGIHCAEVLDAAAELAAGYGLQLENHEYYCGSCLVKGKGKERRRIGLFAHLDIVPPGEGWQYPPLSCTRKDGYLIGRGVGDNKGPGICALYALRFLQENGIHLNHDVMVYFGLSEETGMADIEYFCHTQQVPDLALVTDTNFPVCYGEKGLLRAQLLWKGDPKASGSGCHLKDFRAGSAVNVIPSKAEALLTGIDGERVQKLLEGFPELQAEETGEGIRVRASGISRHAAFPEGAVNAVYVLAHALAESELLEGEELQAVTALGELTSDFYGHSTGIPFEDRESGPLTCVGSVVRMEEGHLKISFDVRYPVTCKGEEVAAAFEKKAGEAGFAFRLTEDSAPAYMPLDRPYIPLLCEICDYVQEKHYEPYTMGGGTYSRKLPAAVGFGPGVPDAPNPFPEGHGQGHQPDECVPFNMLLKGLKTYIIALIELDKLL